MKIEKFYKMSLESGILSILKSRFTPTKHSNKMQNDLINPRIYLVTDNCFAAMRRIRPKEM